MAQQTQYRQCCLERPGDTAGSAIQLTTWIPERKEGVKIEPGVQVQVHEHGTDKDPEGPWWTIKFVGTERQEESRVKERAHNWTKYRAATDV